MNQPRDIERLLDHWLSDGSSVAPDRVLDVVADRIERQPQRPAWRLDWRPITMNPLAKAGAAIAAVVLIALVGFALLPGSTGLSGNPPTPSPTATRAAASSPSPAAVVCDHGAQYCLGPLEPGTHAAIYPFGGTLSYTVPAGWRNAVEGYADDVLAAPGTAVDSPDGGWIDVFLGSYAATQDAQCHPGQDTTVAGGQAKLIAWLRSHPGLVTTAPKPISVSGWSGQTIDVSVAPGWTKTCPGSTKPAVKLIAGDGNERDWGVAGSGKARVIALDIASETAVIVIESSDAANFDKLVSDATPIIESMSLQR